MPLKLDDFDLLQDAYFEAVQSILQSLLPGSTSFILTGCETSINGANITISAGVIYVDGEIYYIPEATYTYDAGKIIYVETNFTTSSNRTFHDTTTHDVWDIRVYKYGYSTEVPEGAIRLSWLFSLRTLLDSEIASSMSTNADLEGFSLLPYLANFSAATAYTGICLEGNNFNGYMLLGAFTASVSSGKLAVLPVGMRPTGDIVGFFFNGTTSPGILKIKANGYIYVSGASTSTTNYISFQFMMRFENTVAYSLPISGGGAITDVVSSESKDFTGRAEEPANPPEGEHRLWVDTDGVLKIKNHEGEIKEIQFVNL